jgi:hypothetical protein
MGQRIDDFGFKSVPQACVFTEAGDTIVHVVPPPSSFQLNTGITETVKEGASRTGVKVNVKRYASEEKPTITLQFPTLTKFISQLVFGRLFEVADVLSTYVGNNIVVPSTGLIKPAPDATKYGFGLAADISGAIASTIKDNNVIQLTQSTPYASFDPFTAAAGSFAQGPNGAIKVSADVIDYPVSFSVPLLFNGVSNLGERNVPSYGLRVAFLDLDNRISLFTCRSVQPVLGKNFDPTADNTQVELAVNYDGTTCSPYEFTYLGVASFC